jgi:hypothetical protein
MTGRLVVLPSRSRILGRSVGYGAAAGAAPGALVGSGVGLLAGQGLLVAVPFGAVLGAFVGVACGLTGALCLIIFRRYVGTGRGAIRAVAGCGAGLPPTIWLIAFAANSGLRYLAVPTALTVVTVALAAAMGPSAFYGKPSRAINGHAARAKSSPSREIVG